MGSRARGGPGGPGGAPRPGPAPAGPGQWCRVWWARGPGRLPYTWHAQPAYPIPPTLCRPSRPSRGAHPAPPLPASLPYTRTPHLAPRPPTLRPHPHLASRAAYPIPVSQACPPSGLPYTGGGSRALRPSYPRATCISSPSLSPPFRPASPCSPIYSTSRPDSTRHRNTKAPFFLKQASNLFQKIK